MSFQLFVEVLCLSLFGMHYIVSFLVFNHLEEEERAGCFAFVVIRMSCYCICSVVLPYGALGWSAVCDCGINFPDHTNLLLLFSCIAKKQIF